MSRDTWLVECRLEISDMSRGACIPRPPAMRFTSISTLVSVEHEISVFADRSYMVTYGQNVNSIKYV